MGFHKSLVRVLLLSALVTGCPLEDDTQVDDAKASANGNDNQGEATNGSDSSDDDNTGGNGDNTGGNGDSNTGAPAISEDAGLEEMDAAMELDAGPVAVADAGHDAGPSEQDAGPTIAVPDLGAADLADADRAKLIYDLMQAEGYVANWFPFFQSNGDQRPLVASGGHSNQVRVRQNAVAKQASDAWIAAGKVGPLVMPNGAIIAKESYKLVAVPVTDPPTPPTYTFSDIRIMAKVAVLDSAAYEGKWFYAKVNVTTNLAERSTTCTGCHNGKTNKALWPAKPDAIPADPGGKLDAFVPYDYLIVPFCADPANVLLCQPPA